MSNIGDKVTESGPAGDLDEVSSSISYALGNNLEDLLLDDAGALLNNGSLVLA